MQILNAMWQTLKMLVDCYIIWAIGPDGVIFDLLSILKILGSGNPNLCIWGIHLEGRTKDVTQAKSSGAAHQRGDVLQLVNGIFPAGAEPGKKVPDLLPHRQTA